MRSLAPSDAWASILCELDGCGVSLSEGLTADAEGFNRASAKARLATRRRKLAQRDRILARAMELHREETEQLELLGRRIENALTPIGRLPTEVLLMVFRCLGLKCTFASMGTSEMNGHPVWLASVCHRWSTIILEPIGASLWTSIAVWNQSEKSLLPALRSLRASLPRSRPLPFRITLRSDDLPAPEPPLHIAVLTHVLAPELIRCQSLIITEAPIFRSLFPLTGCFEKLEKLHLDFRTTGNGPSWDAQAIFQLAVFPSLRSLELLNFPDIADDQIPQTFGPQSFSGTCTRLVLHNFWLSLTGFIQLLRHFPAIQSLEFQNGALTSETDVTQMITDPSRTVTLTALTSLRVNDLESAVLLHLLKYPILKSLSISFGSYKTDRLFVIAPNDHSDLESLTFDCLDADSLDIASIAASHSSIQRVLYTNTVQQVGKILAQIFTHAHSRRGDLSLSNAEESKSAQPVASLDLWLRPSEVGPRTECDDGECLFNLEALSMARQLCERVYGPNFRIHLPPHVMNYSTAFSELVSRFPDFLVVSPEDAVEWEV